MKIHFSDAETFVDNKRLTDALNRAETSLERVKNKNGVGSDWLGWRDILDHPNEALIERIDTAGKQIHRDADVFILCGIGGSYLGARAVIDALKPFFGMQKPEIIYAGNQMKGSYLEDLIRYLEEPAPGGKPRSVYLNVISKSGSTLETALSFRVLRQWMHKQYGDDARKRIICTTSKEGGVLNKEIDAHGYTKFIIPDDIGGRYSVLTPVGLLPIAVSGIDVRSLYFGAVSQYRELEKNPGDVLRYAALRYALHQSGYQIDVLTSFEPEFDALCGWLQQLYGESEGKNGKGLFPVVLNYSTDLHSVGQMVQQGRRNLVETFIALSNEGDTLSLHKEKDDYDGLNYLAGRTFHDINSKAMEGTIEAHRDGKVPVFRIDLEEMNEESLGRFIYFCELSIAVYVYCLGENPFNQPGVEAYKKAMYRLLGKP